MSRYLIIALYLTLNVILTACEKDSEGFDADQIRITAIDRLKEGKTYLLLDGIDYAIQQYKEAGDTIHLLEMYQIASIKMRWKGERDSAAMYLQKAADFATSNTTPSLCDIYLGLSELYSHTLLGKDYWSAIKFAQMAETADVSGENKSRILHDIGLYFAFLNENDSAIVYLDKAIDETPTNSPYYTTFALNYANLPIADLHKSIKYLDNIEKESLGKLITKGFLYLNHSLKDSAYTYLRKSQELYDSAPEKYSINTYNSLRMLSNCVSYSRTGKVYPGEGTVINDSISGRIALNKKIEEETAENNAMLEVQLLASKSRMQRIWIIALAVILLTSVTFGLIFWNNKRKYIILHKEFDRLRQNQILIEADDKNVEDPRSLEIIAKRVEICIDRFRETGIFDIVQNGEIAYNDNNSFLSLRDRARVRQALLYCFADFIIDLKMDAGKLAMDDIVTALLSVMHVSNSAIAACLGVSAGAVRTRKTRLRSKLSDNMVKIVFD